jgi:molecular chaperone GrpE
MLVAYEAETMTNKEPRPFEPESVGPVDPAGESIRSGAEASALPVEPPDQAIARLEGELAALQDKYLRLAAEYDNFRKRTSKERAEAWVRAQAELVRSLIDGLDDLARFAHVDPEETDAKTIHDGVELVERKLWKELEALGVTRVDRIGVPFDPHLHEAVTMGPADHPAKDHTVGAVLQAGYKLHDQLLRPARVVVLTWKGE